MLLVINGEAVVVAVVVVVVVAVVGRVGVVENARKNKRYTRTVSA